MQSRDFKDYTETEIGDMIDDIFNNMNPGEKFHWVDQELIANLWDRFNQDKPLTDGQKQAVVNIYTSKRR